MADQDRIQPCVDSLCLAGCEAVRATIAALEGGLTVSATAHLDDVERQGVLAELKAVMAVYDRRQGE